MGIEADSHRWQMESARILKYVLEAGAFRKINLILTVPYFGMILKHGRGMVHFLIRMLRQGFGWLYVLDADYYRDVLYHWWWHSISFPLPPEHIKMAYERKKALYWVKKVEEWSKVKDINKGRGVRVQQHTCRGKILTDGTIWCRDCGRKWDKNGKLIRDFPKWWYEKHGKIMSKMPSLN